MYIICLARSIPTCEIMTQKSLHAERGHKYNFVLVTVFRAVNPIKCM